MRITALITGGGKRIGRALALDLASRGYSIALHYHRSKKEAQKTATAIRNKGVSCELFQYNLANTFEAEGLVPTVKRKCPGLGILINCASIFEPSKITSQDITVLERHLDINLKAPFILSQNFAQCVKKGHIINILDTQITKNQTSHSAYLLSKKSLAALTEMSAIEFAPDIRVNAVAPGVILSSVHQKDKNLSRLIKRIPLKRKGDLNHLTAAVRFLIDNPFVTGQIIFVDGGEHLLSA